MFTSTPQLTGKIISHYRVLHQIGEGGMGVVYKAEDTKLGRAVALKFLSPQTSEEPEHRERLLREARAAAVLDHPNVCTVYEVDEVDGIPFVSMAFVEGRTLKERIAERPLPIAEAINTAIQIGLGLQSAHENGIVHRDIKPANVMIGPQGQVKIMDFGLALLAGRPGITKTGTTLGTPAYMSPEQVRAEAVDRRSDIWSFGAVLYEMISGRPPFGGGSDPAVAYAIVHQQPEPLTALRSQVPIALDRIVDKALAKNPAERYQHVEDLLVDLRKIAAAVPSPTGRSRRWLIPVIAGAVAVVAGGAFLWSTIPRQAGGSGEAARRLSTGGRPSPIREANEYFEMAAALDLEDLHRPARLLEKALALDPKFAEARAEYAFYIFLSLAFGYSNNAQLLYRAEEEVRRALADDPRCGRAHTVLGAISLSQGRKEEALRELDAAQALNPDHLDTAHWRANVFNFNGDYSAAKKLLESTLDRVPTYFPNRIVLARIEAEKGHFEAALHEIDKTLEQGPQAVWPLLAKARIHLNRGDYEAARRTMALIRAQDRAEFPFRLRNALLLAIERKREQALAAMDKEVERFGTAVLFFTSEVAEFHTALGDIPKALDALEQAVRNGDERSEWFLRDPLLAGMRSDPRFKQILDSIEFRRQRRKAR